MFPKNLLIAVFIAFLIACSGNEPPIAEPVKTEAIFLLIENGGTIADSEQDDANDTVLHLMQQLISLTHHKATRSTQINLVLTATPNRIAWSGSAQQLLEQANDVKALIEFKQSFSDLVMAFDQIQTTINLTNPSTIRLYWIGPAIHVGFQNSTNDGIEITVPQAIPELALPNFADKLTHLKMYRIHNDQDDVLEAYLSINGLIKRAHNGSLDFALFGAAQTKSNLKDLL